jgi:hypothetical protein
MKKANAPGHARHRRASVPVFFNGKPFKDALNFGVPKGKIVAACFMISSVARIRIYG